MLDILVIAKSSNIAGLPMLAFLRKIDVSASVT